jgi:class 3 adenylate cyclase
VVLPFAEDDFLASSVADAGPGWTDRFHQCLARAASVRRATDAAYLGDDVLFSYGSQVAMGLAVLHARYLDAPARQLALWDGRPARGEAGTAVDVATWKARGLPATIIETSRVAVAAPAHRRSPVALAPDRRVLRALLFGDFQGFSRLDDAEIRRFVAHVLEPLAAVLDRYGEAIEQRNSWGDALYIVLRDAASAAACALDLQDATAAIDLAAVGLPPHLALRLGAHVGPVIPVHDPITGQASFMGSHVTRTARIEPVTPPGAVYATEPFAAALILGDDAFTADYAGNIPAAKDHGALRMYRLLRASA